MTGDDQGSDAPGKGVHRVGAAMGFAGRLVDFHERSRADALATVPRAERLRLDEMSDGRLYPKSDKAGTTQRLVDRGWAEWLVHSVTDQRLSHITDEGRKAHEASRDVG